MTTNNENLNLLYKSISVIEIVEKIRSCGVVWQQISPNSYQSSIVQGEDLWDISLVKNFQTEVVTLDFRKNNGYVFSIDSNSDANLTSMYSDMEGEEELKKDQQLLRDITSIPSCP